MRPSLNEHKFHKQTLVPRNVFPPIFRKMCAGNPDYSHDEKTGKAGKHHHFDNSITGELCSKILYTQKYIAKYCIHRDT